MEIKDCGLWTYPGMRAYKNSNNARFSKNTMPNGFFKYKLISNSHIISMKHMCTVWFVHLAWCFSVDLQVFWWRDALTILMGFYVASTEQKSTPLHRAISY